MNKEISDLFLNARLKKDMTQEEIAEAVGVERKVISRLETGARKELLDGELLLRLSQVLDIELNDYMDALVKGSGMNYQIKEVSIQKRKIKELPMDEKRKIFDEYLASETPLSEIIERYHLDARPSGFVSSFGLLPVRDEKCPYCNGELFERPLGRNNKEWQRLVTYRCSICGHFPNKKDCTCATCKERKKIIEKKNREILRQRVVRFFETYEYKEVSYDDISEEELVRLSYGEMQDAISPDGDIDSKRFKDDFRYGMWKKEVFILSDKTPLPAFYSDPEDEKLHVSSENACYRLNPSLQYTKGQFMKIYIEKYASSPEKKLETWRRYAIKSCLLGLKSQLEEVGLELKEGDIENAERVFGTLIESFSCSQIYTLTYRATTWVCRKIQEYKIKRYNAARAVITTASKYGENAISKQWDTSESRYGIIHKEDSMVLNDILGLKKIWFTEVPDISFFQEVAQE